MLGGPFDDAAPGDWPSLLGLDQIFGLSLVSLRGVMSPRGIFIAQLPKS